MNFKDEFKQEMSKISPTEEQAARIRDGVYKKLSEQPLQPKKRKTPLFFGVAVPAAALLGIFVILHFSLNSRINVNENTGNAGNAGNAAISGDMAADNAEAPSLSEEQDNKPQEGQTVSSEQLGGETKNDVTVRLEGTSCVLFADGVERVYHLAARANTPPEGMMSAETEIGEHVFVQFDEKTLTVYFPKNRDVLLFKTAV